MRGLRIGIVIAGDDDHRCLRRQRGRIGEAFDALVAAELCQVGRRDQQRASDAIARDAAGGGEPVRKGVAAQAVRGDEDGLVLCVDRGGDPLDPLVLQRFVPAAELDSLAIGEAAFPQALPMGGATVVKPRNSQDLMADIRFLHGGRSIVGREGNRGDG